MYLNKTEELIPSLCFPITMEYMQSVDILGLSCYRQRAIQPITREPGNRLITASGSKASMYHSLWEQGRHAIRKDGFDAILTNHDGIPGVIAAVLSRRYDCPLIVQLGGDPWSALKERKRQADTLTEHAKPRILSQARDLTLKSADGIITVSEWLRCRVMGQIGLGPNAVQTIRTPITSLNKERDYDREGIILTITNLNFKGKADAIKTGAPNILDAIGEIDGRWIIAGEGSYRQSLQNTIKREADSRGLGGKVEFPGYVDPQPLYKKSDILCYLSFDDGYPTVVLEAQAAGLPVVANRTLGMAEQINDGKSGLFVDRPEDNDLYTVLTELLSDREFRRQIGKGGRDRVVSENDPEKICGNFTKIIGEMI